LERVHPDKPMKPGMTNYKEFEYLRHGSLCLIANFEVATGKVESSTIGLPRTEKDFVNHITKTVSKDRSGRWIFIVDQLNTHQSESLVRWVASECGLEDELGVKQKSGVLKSMPSRKKFLENEAHRIRFIYTPVILPGLIKSKYGLVFYLAVLLNGHRLNRWKS